MQINKPQSVSGSTRKYGLRKVQWDKEKSSSQLFLAWRRNHTEIIHCLEMSGNKYCMSKPVIFFIIKVFTHCETGGKFSVVTCKRSLADFLGIWIDRLKHFIESLENIITKPALSSLTESGSYINIRVWFSSASTMYYWPYGKSVITWIQYIFLGKIFFFSHSEKTSSSTIILCLSCIYLHISGILSLLPSQVFICLLNFQIFLLFFA